MPFGLKNTPQVFQRVMQQILNRLSFIKVYLDDILIHSKTFADHINHCKIVINRLKEANVKINFEKSKFMQPEVKYLGLVINNKRIKADIGKVNHIRNLEPPQNIRQLQKFLGFVNWFRNFLPKLSDMLIPLTDKLKSDNVKILDGLIMTKILDLKFLK
ncbi:POL5 [Hepatospora eriocheir]|uniref:POL5 n=1 Tax=Hepatospora eriocheir TaxID=1081669 RepID=A0A1X0QLB1_9MICR|nr:POL5 [Hepatospora eriocheir]